MLTPQEFKIAKLNRTKAARIFRIRTHHVGNTKHLVDQFMDHPKFVFHRAILKVRIALKNVGSTVLMFISLAGLILFAFAAVGSLLLFGIGALFIGLGMFVLRAFCLLLAK